MERPAIGVAVVVIRDGKILLGKDGRKGNVYAVPGGHWESGETLKECGQREVFEESGVRCDDLQLVSVFDFYREDKQRSYVSIGMKADYVTGELTNLESEERTEWGWYTLDEAKRLPLFPPDEVLLKRYESGIVYE